MNTFNLSLSTVIVLLIVSCQSQVDTPSKKDPSSVERVAYVSFKPGNWDIYQFEAQNKTPRRLTDHPALDYNPVMSPDGRWVIFCSERNGSPDLFVLDLEDVSGSPRLLIDSEAMEDQATISPDGTQLVFVSSNNGNAELYQLPFLPNQTQSMEKAKNLTQHPGGDFRPAFSPDGTRIAFTTDRDTPVDNTSPIARMASGELYMLHLEDGSLNRLTHAEGWDGSPAWSADGQKIVFYSQRGTQLSGFGSNSFIWTMDEDGSNQRLVSSVDSITLSPVFAPDGRIFYANGYGENRRERHWQLISIHADGTDRRVESDSSNSFWEPSFHFPTNTLLAHGTGPNPEDVPKSFNEGALLVEGAPFRKELPDRSIDVFPLRTFTAMIHPSEDLVLYTNPPGPSLVKSSLDGNEGKVLLTAEPRQAVFMGFSWSKDGQWIAYTKGAHFSPVDREADVWKMASDGTGAVNLTPDSPGNDGFPSFSGDGKKMVFRSGRTGDFDIFLMNSDGSGLRNLTNHPASDIFPVFSPTADQVAFVSDRDSMGSRIYEVYLLDLKDNGEPGDLYRITNNGVQEGHLEFSPDGEWLIYTSEKGGINDEEPLVKSIIFAPQMYGEIFAYHLKDRTSIRLTHDKWEDGFPSWGAPVK